MRKPIEAIVLIVLLTSALLSPVTSAASEIGAPVAGGADAQAIARLAPLALNLGPCEKLAYSTEEDFVMQEGEPPDGNPIISDGDLLSGNCAVCARNADLLAVFEVDPDVNLGLDAVDVIDTDSALVVFSTELDDPAGNFTAGDLLILNASLGGAVIPNVALTDPFNVGYDIGLDGVHFVGTKEDIVAFLGYADQVTRDVWLADPSALATALVRYNVDIWFSTEGTAQTVLSPAFLDGDLLSAGTGAIVAPNSILLPTSVPAGVPSRGVDFGLDAVTSSRFVSRGNIRFSTEILYEGGITFTDGDVLELGTGMVVYKNWDLIKCFPPAAEFLGLDALYMEIEPVQEEDVPYITAIGHRPTGDINGGSVAVDGPGTGLATYAGFERPFGNRVPIHGNIPASVYEFRVVYREAGTTRPAPASATGIAVASGIGWQADLWDGSACGNIWVPHSSDGDGWFDATEYISLTSNACSSYLALTVWYTNSAPDPDGHYVIWLQWRETSMGPIIEETVDHHVQLDNTAPEILGLDIAGGACTGYTTGTMPITPTGNFTDTHFWRYRLRIFGGNPPAAWNYPMTTYVADPDVGPMGTGGSYVDLHPVNVGDLPSASIVDCCYGIRLWIEDRTIICYFTPGEDSMPWGTGYEDAMEITFNYTP